MLLGGDHGAQRTAAPHRCAVRPLRAAEIGASDDRRVRRGWLLASVVVNVGVLCVFPVPDPIEVIPTRILHGTTGYGKVIGSTLQYIQM